MPIYVGFDGATHLTSPHEGYDRGVPAVLRGVALEWVRTGVPAGVYIFNYDYRHHRASPFAEGRVQTTTHLALLTDLTDPERLARRDRSYSVSDSALGGVVNHALGDQLRAGAPRLEYAGARYRRSWIRDDPSSSKTTLRPGLADGRHPRHRVAPAPHRLRSLHGAHFLPGQRSRGLARWCREVKKPTRYLARRKKSPPSSAARTSSS